MASRRIGLGTIKNRMAELRWWAERIGKQNIIARDNSFYGIGDRQYATNVSKARQPTSGEPDRITDLYTAMSLRLQAAFGLRRAESIKIQPEWADRCSTLYLKTAGPKERRSRRPDSQRRTAKSSRRSQSIGRQGQPHPGRPELCRAAATIRASMRDSRCASRPRPPTSVCASAVRRVDGMAGPSSGRPELQGTDARAARAGPGCPAYDQRGTGP